MVVKLTAMAASSSSSTPSVYAGTSRDSVARNFNNNSTAASRRRTSSIMRRESFVEGERSALPEVGERTIYVTDEGLIVSDVQIYAL